MPRSATGAPLLERFAEDHARVYLRPNPAANAELRRLAAAGARVGAFTSAPEPLARVAAAHLGVARRIDVLEAGPGALERLLAPSARTQSVDRRSSLARQAVDRALVRDEVELAREPPRRTTSGCSTLKLSPHAGRFAVHDPQAPHRARAVVAEEVPPDRRRDVLAAVDVAAGDRAALAVPVLVDREDERRRGVELDVARRTCGFPRTGPSRSSPAARPRP